LLEVAAGLPLHLVLGLPRPLASQDLEQDDFALVVARQPRDDGQDGLG
jgi:hypothetical protein